MGEGDAGSHGANSGPCSFDSGIATDPQGSVYVATSSDRIQKFTSSGVLIRQWGGRGSGRGKFNGVYGIAVSGTGKVYTTDQFGIPSAAEWR